MDPTIMRESSTVGTGSHSVGSSLSGKKPRRAHQSFPSSQVPRSPLISRNHDAPQICFRCWMTVALTLGGQVTKGLNKSSPPFPHKYMALSNRFFIRGSHGFRIFAKSFWSRRGPSRATPLATGCLVRSRTFGEAIAGLRCTGIGVLEKCSDYCVVTQWIKNSCAKTVTVRKWLYA